VCSSDLDRGDFKGGLVRYYDENYLYINRVLDTDSKIKLIIREIKDLKLELDQANDEVLNIIAQDD